MTHGPWSACRENDAGLDLHIIDRHRSFSVGDLEILPFPVPHDAREPVQYVFSCANTRLGVLTDIGETTPHVCDVLSGCAGLVLEFNHDAGLLERSAYPVRSSGVLPDVTDTLKTCSRCVFIRLPASRRRLI
jgi:phosphoribosyl 1,2-cyclic phosphodiesterase